MCTHLKRPSTTHPMSPRCSVAYNIALEFSVFSSNIGQLDFRVKPSSTTLLGCSFPSPHLKGAGICNSGPCSSARFECCARQHPGHRGHFGKPIKEGVPGLQRGLKAKPPRPTYSIFRSNCHRRKFMNNARATRTLDHCRHGPPRRRLRSFAGIAPPFQKVHVVRGSLDTVDKTPPFAPLFRKVQVVRGSLDSVDKTLFGLCRQSLLSTTPMQVNT